MATEEERNFLHAVFRGDLNATHQALQSQTLRPVEVVNSQGLSALHIAALGNNEEMMRYLVNFVQSKQIQANELSPREQLRTWVNRKAPDGSVCLHFAAYQGNSVTSMQRIIKLLLDNYADLTQENNEGANVLQFASQGNYPKIILELLKHYEISLYSTDQLGKNALHRAAYFGSDSAVELLLALDTTSLLLHSTDTNGNTPLHFAVVSGSTKVVRILLNKGADPHTKDKKGRSPLAISKELQQNAFVELMEEKVWKTVLGIRPPTRPVRFRHVSFALYLLLFVGLNCLNFEILPDSYFMMYLTLMTLKAFLFFTLFTRNPGRLPITLKQSLEELYDQNNPSEICVPCRRLHHNRSRHCYICNQCVSKFDHHCPWIDNCVGSRYPLDRNIGLFYVFLLVTEACLITTFLLNSSYLLYNEDLWEDLRDEWWEAAPMVAASLGAMIVATGFGVSLLALIWVQTVNLAKGKTTSERFSRHSSDAPLTDSDCSLRHVSEMCFNTDSVRVRFSGPKSAHTTITEEPADYSLHAPLIQV